MTEDFKRKLTAILSADVVGYSRLMGDDEESTVRTLNKYKEIIFDLIKRNNGRLVDSIGDNLLAAFTSIVDAVRCGVQIQEDLKGHNDELPTERKMELRIGIHTGDVIQDGERIYGDGVNVAARIESLAEPGGICISRTAYDQVKTKINIAYEYLGEYKVKNIKEPVRIYKIQKKNSQMKIAKENNFPPPSEKPSIVVLPFINMSNDPDQEYFSDGMTEELINALAKLEGLKVISRTSAFFFKGKDVNLLTIGQELKVEHVLEGSVRKAGNKIRITAQLIKVSDDDHLWSENYDRELEDVFAIQDEISNAIVDSLKVRIFGREKEPLVKIHTENINAYEAYIKGYYFLKTYMGTNEKALQYFKKAIELDPCYARAYSAIAEYYFSTTFTGQNISRDEVYAKSRDAINKALEIDNKLPEAHATLGLIKMYYEWDWKGAEEAFKKAVNMNPGLSKSHYDYAFYLSLVGDSERSILEAKKAVELDPLHGITHYLFGVSLCASGQFNQALREFLHAREMIPAYLPSYIIITLTYIFKNMFKEAMFEIKKGLELFPRNPTLLAFMSWIHAKKGEKVKARAILDEIIKISKKEYISPLNIALIYSELGDLDKVLKYMEEGYEERDINLTHIRLFMPLLPADSLLTVFFKKIGL